MCSHERLNIKNTITNHYLNIHFKHLDKVIKGYIYLKWFFYLRIFLLVLTFEEQTETPKTI